MIYMYIGDRRWVTKWKYACQQIPAPYQKGPLMIDVPPRFRSILSHNATFLWRSWNLNGQVWVNKLRLGQVALNYGIGSLVGHNIGSNKGLVPTKGGNCDQFTDAYMRNRASISSSWSGQDIGRGNIHFPFLFLLCIVLAINSSLCLTRFQAALPFLIIHLLVNSIIHPHPNCNDGVTKLPLKLDRSELFIPLFYVDVITYPFILMFS